MSASTGGSVVVTARLSATAGQAVAIAIDRSRVRRQPMQSRTECGTPRLSAAASPATVTSTSQTRGSPGAPCSPIALGRPNRAMAGK